MGSFAASVDLPEQLRPFAQAGLELLFAPEGLSAQDRAWISAEAAPAPSLQNASAPASPHTDASGASPQPPAAAAPKSSIAPEVWPEPWRTLYARVRTTPRVIITYASLADDMAGNADPARRRLLHSMLTFLNWPQGTTLFWPISFPTGVDPGPFFAADIFSAGVAHFAIRHVVCLGTNPADRVRTLYPQEGQSPPVLLHAAPAPEDLVTLLPHELHQALAHIKTIKIA